MTDLIRLVLAWVSALLAPRASGRHRARPASRAPRATYPLPVQGPLRAPRRPDPRALPRARSPYGLEAPLRGEDVELIRPYLIAYEEQQREQQRRERRRALVFAAHFGIDLDTRMIHSVRAAR